MKQSDSLRTQPATPKVMDPKSLRHFHSILEAMWIYQKEKRTTESSQLSSDIFKSDLNLTLDGSPFSESWLPRPHLARKIKKYKDAVC